MVGNQAVVDTNSRCIGIDGSKTMLGVDRITFDPKIMAGQACIRGMGVPVSLVLNLVANGQTPEVIIEDHRYLV
jgi:uncharacterized protein (DUF433 family)